MFERFTDRARKVMALANQEAQRFNHEYIGTEHMLLGLVKEGSGIGANVLKRINIDLRKIRLEVEKMVKSGPDMVTMGKLPQAADLKAVLQSAILEARNMDNNWVGTEHLLLGLLIQSDSVACQILMNLGVSVENIKKELKIYLSEPPKTDNSINIPVTDSDNRTGYSTIGSSIPQGILVGLADDAKPVKEQFSYSMEQWFISENKELLKHLNDIGMQGGEVVHLEKCSLETDSAKQLFVRVIIKTRIK